MYQGQANYPLRKQTRERVYLEGSVTIDEAWETAMTLLTALERAEGQLVVDCTGVTAADFVFVQLLCSAHQTALEMNKEIETVPGKKISWQALAGEAGVHECLPCPRRAEKSTCLWTCTGMCESQQNRAI